MFDTWLYDEHWINDDGEWINRIEPLRDPRDPLIDYVGIYNGEELFVTAGFIRYGRSYFSKQYIEAVLRHYHNYENMIMSDISLMGYRGRDRSVKFKLVVISYHTDERQLITGERMETEYEVGWLNREEIGLILKSPFNHYDPRNEIYFCIKNNERWSQNKVHQLLRQGFLESYPPPDQIVPFTDSELNKLLQE